MQPQLTLTKEQAAELYRTRLAALDTQISTNESCLSPLRDSHAALSRRIASGVTMATIADSVREMAAALIALMHTQILQLDFVTKSMKEDRAKVAEGLKEAESSIVIPRPMGRG